MGISIHTAREIDIMRRNGRILAKILADLKKAATIGVSGKTLENLANKLIQEHGGKPSFKGFDDYPFALCFSLNHEIVHAAPGDDKVIREGDIVSLDLGFYKDGLHTDAAISFAASSVNPQVKKLLDTTRDALSKAVRAIKPGVRLGKISHLIQKTIGKAGFSVVRELTGHGIGRTLHEDPHVFNYGEPESGPVLKSGMVLAIEPMASMGSSKIKKGKDGFAYETRDGSLSAHFEHTVAITKEGCEVLTRLD